MLKSKKLNPKIFLGQIRLGKLSYAELVFLRERVLHLMATTDNPVAMGALVSDLARVRDEITERRSIAHGAPCPDCGGSVEAVGWHMVCRDECGFSIETP
jgi:hypothetical protein